MMLAMIRKEIRGLRPWLGLAVLLSLIGLGATLATEFPDDNPFKPAEFLSEHVDGLVIFLLLMAVVTGAGLLVNEDEHGTLLFLDGLPLTRSRIFVAKAIAGLVILGAMLLFEVVQLAAMGLISQDSTSGPFPWKFLCLETGLLFAMMASAFGVVLWMSFLRRWLALAIGMVVWMHLLLQMQHATLAAWFDPLQLVRPGLDGSNVQVPWRHLGAQLTAGGVCGLLAWWRFARLGGRQAVARTGFRRFLRQAWTLGLAASMLVVWIGVMVMAVRNMPPDEDDRPGKESGFDRIKTRHYEFLLREDQRAEAQELTDVGDLVFETVWKFFEKPPVKGRVVVDLASPVVPQAAAQAHWKKVRMTLESGEELGWRKAVLGHETAHVCIDLASEAEASRRFEWTRWLHEGLATYVEARFFQGATNILEYDRMCAHASDRERVRFSDLIDNGKFSAIRDANLVYPLGRAWCLALARTCGDTAPVRICRALDHPSVRASQSVDAFWRRTLQQAGFDLEKVNAAFESDLDGLMKTHRDWLRTIPRLSAVPVVTNAQIVLKTAYERPSGEKPGTIVARLSDRPPNENLQNEQFTADADGVIRVSRTRFPGPTLWFQLGWLPARTAGEGRLPLFEKWEKVVLN